MCQQRKKEVAEMKSIPKLIGSNAAAMVLLTAAAFGLWQAVPTPPAEAAPAVDHGLMPISTPASFADVIEAVKPAVVNISSSAPAPNRQMGPGQMMPFPEGQIPGNPSMEEFFRRFFDRQSGSVPQGERPLMQTMGSGFIVADDGLVVTNNHVVDGATEIVVTMNNGSRHSAELVGRDPKTDLALLKIESDEPLPFASFGDSEQTRAGDWVIAIGNPFGLGGTATTGIVSARGRDIQAGPFDDFLQIDAPINRGNSGGPLFDTAGRVIGINTAIYSPTGGNVGIGFAIPASLAAPIVEQLRNDGYVERGWLGVQIQQIDEEIAEGLGLESSNGALVASVVPDSPADLAGLTPGDVIVGFDDKEIEDIKDLTRQVAAVRPDSEIDLQVWRDGKTVDIEVDLGENPEDLAVKAGVSGGENGDSAASLGLSLMPLTPDSRRRFGVEESVEGALVASVDPSSPAARKGLRPGDVILGVGQEAVSGPSEVVDEVARLREDERPSVVFQVARGGDRRFLAVPLA
jgi:serine protease Do